MRLIGFNFNKIEIEKFKEQRENLEIKNNIEILDIKKAGYNILKLEGEVVVVSFQYILDYSQDIAKLELKGDIILEVDPKLSKEILEKWKNKEILGDFKIGIFNIILRKSNLKALQLEEEMNLPLHFSMPKISREKNE